MTKSRCGISIGGVTWLMELCRQGRSNIHEGGLSVNSHRVQGQFELKKNDFKPLASTPRYDQRSGLNISKGFKQTSLWRTSAT